MIDLVKNLLVSEDGATAVEYAIMLGAISAVIFVAVQNLGAKVIPLFTTPW